MGLSTEQTTAVIDSVGRAIDAATPDTVVHQQPEGVGFWALCFIAVLPLLAAGIYGWFKRRIIIGWIKKKRKI